MSSPGLVTNPGRVVLAGLVAGVWVLVSGLVMAGIFGYREMKAAFDAIGLSIPSGAEPFVVLTLVRLVIGVGVVALYAIFLRVLSTGRAMLAAAGFVWVLGTLLPLAVIVEWGLFSWSLAAKQGAWSAGETLVAAVIGRMLYRP